MPGPLLGFSATLSRGQVSSGPGVLWEVANGG
jgi:hypothetical protein